jgi:hypothetical protein
MKMIRTITGCVLVGCIVGATSAIAGHTAVSVGISVGGSGHRVVSVGGVLSSHGQWVDHAAYGWMWRPAVSVEVRGWHPYRDGGHWHGVGRGRRWESQYGWGAHIYGAGGRWVLSRGSWCWVPPHGWAHCPPARYVVVRPAPVVRCYPPVHPSPRRYRRPVRVVAPHPYHRRSVRAYAPAPVVRHSRVVQRAPHVPPRAPVHPPAASRIRPQTQVRRGGRLDALVRRHRAR